MSIRRSNLTPAQRSMNARIASLHRWSQCTPEERAEQTQRMRDALAAKFDAAPNPEAAAKEHYTRMAAASVKARQRKQSA